MGSFRETKDSFLEILWLIKGCLTSFWYWLPILIMVYMLVQLWMMIFIHPLTLLILPVILTVYGLRMEEKRIRARYGLASRRVKWSHGIGGGPERVTESELEIERLVEEYEHLLEEDEKKEKEV
jgi:hypothetical protein